MTQATPLIEEYKDRTGRPIAKGVYYATRGNGNWKVDNTSEMLAIIPDAAGFRFVSNLGYENILGLEVAARLLPADDPSLRGRAHRLETELTFFKAHIPQHPISAPAKLHLTKPTRKERINQDD